MAVPTGPSWQRQQRRQRQVRCLHTSHSESAPTDRQRAVGKTVSPKVNEGFWERIKWDAREENSKGRR